MTLIRNPVVAGSFYPADRQALVDALEAITLRSAPKARAIGALVPHAGYVYSGRVAGTVYSRILLPQRYLLLGPNHTGLGPPLSIMSSGEWRTPIGGVPIDRELAERLKELNSDLEEDTSAHRAEHALEVQLPFLQFLRGPDARFVPISVGTADLATLERLGDTLAELVRSTATDTLIVASSDMNHYESDTRTREKDQKAIRHLLDRDAEGLYRTVIRDDISMCGFGPATAMLRAANDLGASEAALASYGTSADAFGEKTRVVGYAGVILS